MRWSGAWCPRAQVAARCHSLRSSVAPEAAIRSCHDGSPGLLPCRRVTQQKRANNRRMTMGLLDWLTGTKRPEAGVASCSALEVRERILAINRPTAPFHIIDGADEGVDLIAEW